MHLTRRNLVAGAAALGTTALVGEARAADTELSFFYPIAVGGPVTKLIDTMCAAFQKQAPGITIKPVYSGSYQDTITKALTSAKGGQPPQVAVALSTDVFTLVDQQAIVAFDDVIDKQKANTWFKSFYPGFMANSVVNGKTWSIPFQRSTIVLYWNKDAFKEVGLDPDKPPQTWDELRAFSQKLTKRDAAGNVTRWGIEIPSSGTPYWQFQALTTENGAEMANQDGTKVSFDQPAVVEALQFWTDLSNGAKVQPPGIVDWGIVPTDFFQDKTAMMMHTTGNLTNVRDNAKFPFGVAMLPAKIKRGTPTGGGNFYLFKGSTPAQQAAAVSFVDFMTSPEQAAQWSIATGYVAVSPAAFETDALKKYVAAFPPAAVARDQLKYAVRELSTHDNQRVITVLDDNIQAALTATKTSQVAMRDAQAQADRILKAYN